MLLAALACFSSRYISFCFFFSRHHHYRFHNPTDFALFFLHYFCPGLSLNIYPLRPDRLRLNEFASYKAIISSHTGKQWIRVSERHDEKNKTVTKLLIQSVCYFFFFCFFFFFFFSSCSMDTLGLLLLCFTILRT